MQYYTTRKALLSRYKAIRSEGSCLEDRMQYSISPTVQALNKLALQCASFEEFIQKLPGNVVMLEHE